MNYYHQKYIYYKKIIDRRLLHFIRRKKPEYIYKPLEYILAGGGKRIRPILVILSCEAVGGNFRKAINAGIAMETLHNFTLIHDDIMDNADKRRGKETIHKKWNRDIAILAGDALLALSYEILLKTDSVNIKDITKIFTNSIIEVCEGQSYDKEFETKSNVSIKDYLMMIEKKTAHLLMACSVIGALIGNSNNEKISALKNYAKNIGIAFRIQDDLLDIMGDDEKFGKEIGGDLKEGKKTFLLIKALEVITNKSERKVLEDLLKNKGTDSLIIINKIKYLYEKYNIINNAKDSISYFTYKAKKSLLKLKNKEAINMLNWFSDMLMYRKY